jgi:hypothetical protein
LLKSKKFIFKKQSKHYDLLSDTLDVFREARENELGLHHSELKALKLDFIADMSCFNCSRILLRLASSKNRSCVFFNVHMDKNGNYKVVHGLKLDEIPKGDLKVLIKN